MKNFDAKIRLLTSVLLLMVAIHIVNTFTDGSLVNFGIIPKDPGTLPFIFTAPFIHGSWGHLLNNLFGMGVFSALCLIRGVRFYVLSSLIIIVSTGVCVWLVGRPNIHVGASGWIFGLWSLSIAMAWFQRSFVNIAIAVFVALFYGGMAFGVLPSNPNISFESHLFGAISGVLCAYLMAGKKKNES